MIIGISGKLKSGKDETARLIEMITFKPFYRKKFADKLKGMIAVLLSCDVNRLEDQNFKEAPLGYGWNGLTPRYLMQTLGTEWGRTIYDDIWVQATMSTLHPEKSYIITDVRFPNEAEAIKKVGGKVIRINRPSESNTGNHPSETALDNYQGFDYIITNDDTLTELAFKVGKMCGELKL